LAENIRTRLESAELGEIGQVTASFGVTTFDQGDDAEALIARADAGLYAAKVGGRNRIEVGTPVAGVT
jgi:chemotaxis family two-component system sensor kinase Cph1